MLLKDGGDAGIRTLDTALNHVHDFQSCSLSQLGHVSANQGQYFCAKNSVNRFFFINSTKQYM
jgi:hypothetical protein